MTTSLNFFKQYHSTMVKALGEDAKKVNTKIGSMMADVWISKVDKFNDNNEFAQSFEDYLKNDLEFTKYVNVDCDDKNYTLDIKGCAICHGNEILRRDGIGTMCPIMQAAKYAAVKRLGRNVITKGVDKPGPVGECIMRFELEPDHSRNDNKGTIASDTEGILKDVETLKFKVSAMEEQLEELNRCKTRLMEQMNCGT